jgi:transposase InsO family protein
MQEYHSNAVTNVHIRGQIKASSQSDSDLSVKYSTSVQTIRKWRARDTLTDKPSRPDNIEYALSDIEQAVAVSARKSTWMPLDEVWEMLLEINPSVTRSAVYRTFARHGVNKAPQEQKVKAKKFKEYEPGFLHMDVTYLPKLSGTKLYLYVAVDRATRALYYEVYDAKTATNTEDFMEKCIAFFPFVITHVLTDNGLEFTNRLIKSKKGELCNKPSKLDDICADNNIDHRLTKPNSPQTNGMVERVNGTIKNATILRNTYPDKNAMQEDLWEFLVNYMLFRRHGGVRKELGVKTPFNAIEKWFEIKPELFKIEPSVFKEKIISLSIGYKRLLK